MENKGCEVPMIDEPLNGESSQTHNVTEMNNKRRKVMDHVQHSSGSEKSGTDALESVQNSLELRKPSANVEEGKADTSTAVPAKSPEPHSTYVSPRARKKPVPYTKFQSELLKTLERSREGDDPDKLYLLSLLPYYKSLTEAQKLQFQQQSLNFIMSAKGAYRPAQHTVHHSLHHPSQSGSSPQASPVPPSSQPYQNSAVTVSTYQSATYPSSHYQSSPSYTSSSSNCQTSTSSSSNN